MVSYDGVTTDYGVTLQANTLTVDAGGLIESDGQGYAIAAGPGAGVDGDKASGAGHGGVGGDSSSGVLGGNAYGSLYEPITLGSGGGNSSNYWSRGGGGSGGGAIKIEAENEIILNGIISSNGFDGVEGSYGYDSGGGSGGSIWVITDTFSGSGEIQANGGTAGSEGGGGAGGRVAIYTENLSPSIQLSVNGGSGYETGGEGTTYLDDLDPVLSSVAIAPTSLVADGSDIAVVTVVLKNTSDLPMPNKPVEIAIATGTGLNINGQYVETLQYLSIGNTDENGAATAELSTTVTGIRTIKARSGQEIIVEQGNVEFIPGTLNQANSSLSANPTQAFADGETSITLNLTARDSFNNPIPGATILFQTTGSATITQPVAPTDSQGEASGSIVDAVSETVTVSATVSGTALDDQVTLVFQNADLSISKGATAQSNDGQSSTHALAGGTITYTLTIENTVQGIAAAVTVTDALPDGLAFASESSDHTYVLDGNTITWQVGDLAESESATIEFVANIGASVLGEITNTATTVTSSHEEDLTDNTATLNTIVETAVPILDVSPLYPALTVLQGESGDLMINIHNDGAGEMSGIIVTPPPHIPWVAVDTAGLTQLTPGASADITLTATVDASLTPGHYRDFVMISDDSGGQVAVALTVHVTTLSRPLMVTVENDQGQTVSGATLVLIKEEASVLVTEGVTETFNFNIQANSTSTGRVNFISLEVGTYDYTLSADDHETATGTLTIIEGEGTQTQTLTLTAQPELTLTPNELIVGAAQGETQSYDISIQNDGAATMTGLTVSLPSALPWVAQGVANPLPDIAPGESLGVTFIIGPPADLAVGAYQDFVTVTANGGLSQQAALTIEVVAAAARDLAYTVENEEGAPITTSGEIILVQQDSAILQLPGGEEVPYNPQFKETLDGSGIASFSDLTPGEYNYLIQSEGYSTETGTIQIVSGAGAQTQISLLPVDPFSYSWTVEQIEQAYDITLTLTYDFVDAPPALFVAPQNWNTCNSSQISRNIEIHNPTDITLYLDDMDIIVPGAEIASDDLPESMGPGETIYIPITADFEDGDMLSSGAASVGFTYLSAPDHVVTYTLNPSSLSQNLDGSEILNQQYAIDLVMYEEGVSYTIGLGEEGAPAWITSLNLAGSTLDAGGTTLDLAVDPSTLYAGEYTYDAELEVHGSDTSERYGTLHIEATKDENGVTLVHTTFELGDLIYEEKSGYSSSGGEISTSGCSDSDWDWVWDWDSNEETFTGSYSHEGVSVPNHVVPPTYGNGHQQVRLEILQKMMMEGEGFLANLDLSNTSGSALSNVSVDIIVESGGTNRTDDFKLTPLAPTDLGSLGAGESVSEEWLIIPSSTLNLSSPENFTVRAVISEGGNIILETAPEIITVYPAPDLILNYELPYPEIPCTVFDLKVNIVNQGLGTARNLRFSSAMPQLVDPMTSLPINFSITAVTVDGVPQGNELNLILEDLAPGEETEIVFWIETNTPGKFVEFTSDYRQSNYEGVLLTPLISEINTTIVPGECLSAVPCDAVFNSGCEDVSTAYSAVNNFIVYPINTSTGGLDYSYTDISIPTSAGSLTFKRWYASPTTDIYMNNLSAGWTHSLDTRLIFPDDPEGRAGVILFKACSANRYEFREEDGVYIAYAGLNADLVRNEGSPVTYTITDKSQKTFTFDEDGHLLSKTDAEGNTLNYAYDGNGQLMQVSDDSTQRYLNLSYDAQGRIASISDHTGRQVQYGYDAVTSDLTSTIDILGQTWTYAYDDANHPHYLTEVIDPDGVTAERTEFDAEGRAVRQYNGADELLVELTYNADGTTTVTDADGNTETHTYDERNTIVGETNPLGATTGKTYDDNFRPETITDEGGNTTHLIWSADGANLTNIEDAAGNETSITYDALNNPTSVSDPLGHQTTYIYDGSLLSSSTDALNNTTSYTYTADGKLETVTDALGHTTSYTYDGFGQMLTVTDALGNLTNSNTYDDLGRLVDSVDAQGRVTHNEYDALGRLLRVTQNYVPARNQNDENLYNIVTEYGYDSVGNQIAVTDTYGSTTQYEYDNAGRMVKSTDPAGNENLSSYNELGQLVSSTDALGHTTSYVYDVAGRMTGTTDAVGNTTSTSYNLDGTVASSTDALGHSTTYAYDELKRVVATTDHLGNSTSSTYDAAGNLETSTDKLGNSTTYEYDALGRMFRQTDSAGNSTETVYDENGNRVQSIDARGKATVYAYDDLGRMVGVTDALGNETTTTYNNLGQRTAMTDAKGNTATFAYDILGRQVSVTDAEGNAATTTYDALGRVLTTTDALGNVNSSVYDSLGRLVSQTNPAGGVTSFTYNAVGNQLTVTDPNEHIRSTAYDALNRAIESTDPNGNITSTTYNAVGQVVTSTNALGNEVTFLYDDLGRQTSITDPLGNISQYGYDANGNRTSMIDPLGIVTFFEYDAIGRLSAVVENYQPVVNPTAEINVRTEYSYDANGNRLTITDGKNHVSSFSYDDLNRLLQETDPMGNTWQHAYDAVGNRLSLIDANGATTTYSYDSTNRLTDIDYPSTGSGQAPGDDMDVSFAYDEIGRRTQMDDGLGTTTWAYDELNRPTAITDQVGDTVGYSYDAVGNRTGLTYPDGKQVEYAYDPANRLSTVTDWQSYVTSYNYDASNRITSTNLPNGVTSNYAYDEAGRLTDIQHQTVTTPISSFQYVYDGAGNRIQASEIFSVGEAGPTVLLSLANSSGMPLTGQNIYVFNGEAYTGYTKVTDANGQASITLPEGDYRFRADVDGTQFWSDETNHCQIAGCTDVMMTIPDPVLVTVQDSAGVAMADLSVYVFDGTTYTNFNGTTDENGQLSLRLPEGNYRFRADFNGTQFWSDESNHCAVPGCSIATVNVTLPVTLTVADELAMPQAGVNVYAFDGTTYTSINGTTDANGQVDFTLPEGNYRFRADFNGTQFWSGASNHCTVPSCNAVTVAVSQAIPVTVHDTEGTPMAGLKVYAFDGASYTGYNKTTDTNGETEFTLPEGNYRFRADLNGTQFWSDTANHCTVPGCGSASVTVSTPLTVTVQDTDGVAASGLKVYAFDGATYTSYNKTTDANGQALFTLPLGSYRFRADLNSTQFWSENANHCDLPGCVNATVTISKPVTIMIQNGSGQPESGVNVYAFDGTTYRGYNKTSDANGETVFTLPLGNYRFRADFDGTQYWSDAGNSCEIPSCESDLVIVDSIPNTPTPTATIPATTTPTATATQTPTPSNTPTPTATNTPEGSASIGGSKVMMVGFFRNSAYQPQAQSSNVVLSVSDTEGSPASGLNVYAFNGTTYSGVSGSSDANGQVTLALPAGDYRFRADLNGTQFWSGEINHCTTPTCTEAAVIVTIPMTVTVSDTDNNLQAGLKIYVFDDAVYTGFNGTTDANGQVDFTLPQGNYHFRADLNGTQFWSGGNSHCALPGCTTASVTVTIPLTVTVSDTGGTPQAGLNVYAFDGTTYTGFNKTTDASGEVEFTLPEGNYRFRADMDGTQFWSNETNHCTLPSCTSAAVIVTGPTLISVQNTAGEMVSDLSIYAFDGDTYTGFNGTTDVNGQVGFTLPEGDYRFRADLNGTQFWSGEANHCTISGCTAASITVTIPLTVTVFDTSNTPQEGLNVYAFDGGTYTGYNGVTDENGEIAFTLPEGDYRFRADLSGTQFWSGEINHCTLPSCTSAAVTVTETLIVTVLGNETGVLYPDLNVYAFTDDTYTGYNGVTDENGQVDFTLPEGDYHFRADYDGVQFWSSAENDCILPSCAEASVILPGALNTANSTIDYTYDSLYRLTAADYDNGDYYHYTYDSVGNRLSMESSVNELLSDTNYTYDLANRMSSAGDVFHTYDANGNLLDDGVNTYIYDAANRLISVNGQTSTTYAYGGLGDRHQQNGVIYTLDIVAGLTQVLSDGTNTYLYGNGRISQHATQTEYFLGDALGSVRQLADTTGAVTLTQSYAPYGETISSVGSGASAYQFTGEMRDANGLTYLRARYYNSADGRFLSRDTWGGDYNRPLSLNRWGYVEGNPVNLVDPTGNSPERTTQILNKALSQYSNSSIILNSVICLTETGIYDLTDYLARAMTKHGQDIRVKVIANKISGAYEQIEQAIHHGGGQNEQEAAIFYALGQMARAYADFNKLEGKKQEWDIKVPIKQELGENIILCGIGNNCHWLDYSTTGNIHFGYVAGLAKIDYDIAAFAGGVLEQINFLIKIQWPELQYCNQNSAFGFCDNPQDQAAVDFGYTLAENYENGITTEAFKQALQANGMGNFQRAILPSDRHLYPTPFPGTVFYDADYFDN